MNHKIAAGIFDELSEHALACQPVIQQKDGSTERLPEVSCTMGATFKACAELVKMDATAVHEMFSDDYTMNDFIADITATSLEAGQRTRRAMEKTSLNPLDCPVIHRAISAED